MTARPSGTVTFLFTDIEGSTQLWDERAGWMARAHARQEALLREIFAAHDGYPYKMIGDAFQVAFDTAPAALAAAAEAQRALHAEAWGEAPIRVRMAIHSGETEERGDDYVGPLLNRVARLMSAGHGGQVLVTQATYELVRDRLPHGVSLRDLGEKRLRDLNRPEHVHELVIADLEHDFPALKTLDAIPNNLPVQLTHFIGRERSLAELTELLARSRLVTLTGSGGAGKTRLSLQLGGELLERFSHGVWFVELAPIADEREIAQAVATALGIVVAPGRPVLEVLAARLAGEERLVIVDNCEHVVHAAAEVVSSLLAASPRSRVIATTREPLRVPGEATYRVPSLAMVDPEEDASFAELARSEAVKLFVDRAMQVASTFTLGEHNVAVVADICRRLDGIPLAIELAAARASSLTPEQIADRLGDRFRLLTRGARVALPRQQTLRALIDWSHDLLDERERTALRRLAVFAGGFTLEAAEAVCAGGDVDGYDVVDLLTNLIEKSLVVHEPDRGRYRLLETIRAYALERLKDSGEEGAVRDLHLEHFLALAERAPETAHAGDAGAWLAFDADLENLVTVHSWCDQAPRHVEAGLRLVVALAGYLRQRGRLDQGRRLIRQALARPGTEPRTLLRCKALYELVRFAFSMGRYAEAEGAARESLAIARELGADDSAAVVLRYLAGIEATHGNFALSREHSAEAVAIARRLGDPETLGMTLTTAAELLRYRREHDAAQPLYEEVIECWRRVDDRANTSIALLNVAMNHVGRGEPERSIGPTREALALAIEFDLRMSGQVALDVCAGLAAVRGELANAARFYGASEEERGRSDFHRDPPDEAYLRPLVDRARAALGAEAFDAAEREGRERGFDDSPPAARDWLANLAPRPP
ncbi:MAG: tetratricopeptide repeat protein [Deltaproteobacteria bacterium]|nr:tetratricopeptide repeat protein [Deltaproteobacteria bacterium]